MEIKIILNGAEQTVTKQQLWDLAANGTIRPDTTVRLDGRPIPAAKLKGITFGQPKDIHVPVSPPTSDSGYNDPFSFDSTSEDIPFAEISPQIPQQYASRNSAVGGGKAIASFVCGIISLVLCGGGLIVPIIGLVFGILGLNSKNRGLAVTGIVLSSCSVFLSLISVALLLPAVQAAREAARRMQCSSHVKDIASAFHNFYDTHQALPALYTVDEQGQPLHSWRVLILPSLGETELYQEIRLDEPWDSEYNKQFHSRMPAVYACPSNNHASSGNQNRCCYSAIVGEGWNRGDANKEETGISRSPFRPIRRGNKDKTKKGVLTPAEKTGLLTGTTDFSSITDGLSSTLLVIEVKEPFCWMNPTADKTFNDLEKIGTERGSYHINGFNIALMDGTVRFVSNTVDPQVLSAIGTRDGGESLSLAP
ncbi:MAG: DUF1559 domain-containing protein [Planctomycetaceae bacterium]|nr:DUF1559 domain-containing protein [Planctomycetaceae bacterium]